MTFTKFKKKKLKKKLKFCCARVASIIASVIKLYENT